MELHWHWNKTPDEKPTDGLAESEWGDWRRQFANGGSGGVRDSVKSCDRPAEFEACCKSNLCNTTFQLCHVGSWVISSEWCPSSWNQLKSPDGHRLFWDVLAMDQLGLHVFVMDGFCSESIVCVERLARTYRTLLESGCRRRCLHCRTITQDWHAGWKVWWVERETCRDKQRS